MNGWYYALPVLITGGAGFIGSHLVEKLVSLGAKVTVLDNLSTGSLKNLATVSNKITFIQADITDYAACFQAAKNQKVIFHLAAFVSVPESIEKADLCYKTNVLGTLNLLQAAIAQNVSSFIFSSSASVYGPTNQVCVETMICKPKSPYAHSKLLGEHLCHYFATHFGMTAIVLRYFNVYGSRQNPGGSYASVIAKFKHAMSANQPLTIFGDGLQTRDFISVEQVVQANLELVPLIETGSCEIFNIASGQSISLLELIVQLRKDYPLYSGDISFLPDRSGDILHSKADCSKYKLFKKREKVY